MKEKLVFVALAFMIFSVSLASAQTLITGKIYSEGYSDIISGADVTVICGDTISTDSLDDGTYAIYFEVGVCNLESPVQVSATKGDLYGEGTGTVAECNDGDCVDSDYLAVLNLMIKAKSSSSSSSSSGGGHISGKYYFCGNNKCDTGETAVTCPRDCQTVSGGNSFTTLGVTNPDSNSGSNGRDNPNPENIVVQQEDKPATVSGITGAVIGFGKTTTEIGLASLIIIFIVIVMVILAKKKRKSSFY